MTKPVKQTHKQKQKQKYLSPDIAEILHMIKSLEQLPDTTRSRSQ